MVVLIGISSAYSGVRESCQIPIKTLQARTQWMAILEGGGPADTQMQSTPRMEWLVKTS